jgi:hypothetical protein
VTASTTLGAAANTRVERAVRIIKELGYEKAATPEGARGVLGRRRLGEVAA